MLFFKCVLIFDLFVYLLLKSNGLFFFVFNFVRLVRLPLHILHGLIININDGSVVSDFYLHCMIRTIE